MRRDNSWLQYLCNLSEQGRDLAQQGNVYAHQWAHDVRCIRKGIEHRRVGESTSQQRNEWLQAGYVVRAFAR
ncbi:MAG: hypothetical protein QM808_08635 [Steroidobacteraceae bacterium]